MWWELSLETPALLDEWSLSPFIHTLDDIPLVIALYGDNWTGSPLTHLRDTSVELTVNPALTSVFSTIE